MKKKNHDWQMLLLRWLSGEATRKDEQALEALAGKDPFLADALEGYRSMPSENHAEAVTKLKAKLHRHYEKRRRGAAFFLIRMAAAGAILLVAWVAIQLTQKSKDKHTGIAEISQRQMQWPVPPSEETASRTESALAEPKSLVLVPSQTLPDRTTRQMQPPAFAPVVTPDPRREATIPDSAYSALATHAQPQADTSPLDYTSSPPPSAGSKDTSFAQGDEKESKPALAPQTQAAPSASPEVGQKNTGKMRTISGKVTDEKGQALTGVSIHEKGTAKGTVTNTDGSFEIAVTGKSPALVFSYTGFATREIVLQEETYLEVQIQESSGALSEIVVTAAGKQKSKSKSRKAESASPEPENGFTALEKYIRNNLRYPEQALLNKIEGNVTLRFRIQPDGTPGNFTVLQSPGFGCTEEAQRLLESGPKWKWESDNEVTYTILFQLKK